MAIALDVIAFNFNPLHREGGDALYEEPYPPEEEISIHSTARVETFWASGALSHFFYFNPLHREGGDDS